jgi:hypothetical protein
MTSPWVNGGAIAQYINSLEYDPQIQRIPLVRLIIMLLRFKFSDIPSVDRCCQGLDYIHQRGVAHGDIHDVSV